MHTYFNFIVENISQENNIIIQFIKILLTIFNFQTFLRQAANILSDDLIKRWTWFLADDVRWSVLPWAGGVIPLPVILTSGLHALFQNPIVVVWFSL